MACTGSVSADTIASGSRTWVIRAKWRVQKDVVFCIDRIGSFGGATLFRSTHAVAAVDPCTHARHKAWKEVSKSLLIKKITLEIYYLGVSVSVCALILKGAWKGGRSSRRSIRWSRVTIYSTNEHRLGHAIRS